MRESWIYPCNRSIAWVSQRLIESDDFSLDSQIMHAASSQPEPLGWPGSGFSRQPGTIAACYVAPWIQGAWRPRACITAPPSCPSPYLQLSLWPIASSAEEPGPAAIRACPVCRCVACARAEWCPWSSVERTGMCRLRWQRKPWPRGSTSASRWLACVCVCVCVCVYAGGRRGNSVARYQMAWLCHTC
jgi:hypothetical protein